MSDQPLLGNASTTTERQRLLEQLKKLDQKDEQALQEREALIGKIIVAALKSGKLSGEDFSAFLTPLVTKKSEAKKLGLNANSEGVSLTGSLDISPSSASEDEGETELEDDTEATPSTNGYIETEDEDVLI